MAEPLGLIAGSGRLPLLFAEAARARGHAVHAVAHLDETEPGLSGAVDSITWVRVGQVGAIAKALTKHGVARAVLAGGIGRVRSITQARPDLGALKLLSKLRSTRDDEMLRAVASYFEGCGIRIVAATDYVPQVFVSAGHLAGPALSSAQADDVKIGLEVATLLGQADVGQTVVVKGGAVLAVEAVEGTDACIRRAGALGGSGAVVVKRVKPGQDVRFDLPAVGPATLEVMREVGASTLAIEAQRTIVIDASLVFKWAGRLGISVVAV